MAPKPKPKQLQPDGIAAQAAVANRLPTVVAGLDTASDRLHLFCNNGLTLSHTCPDKMEANDRRHELYTQAKVIFSFLPRGALLVCEEPLALQNGKTTRLLGLAAGAIWAAHLDFAVFWAWADVSAWKKSVIGNGNANKAAIQAWVTENMGLKFDQEDFYDAAAICRYGEQAVGLV